MLDKIERWVRGIPISTEAFGFAAVVASAAPAPDAAVSLVFNIRYLPMSHSLWSVLSSLTPIALIVLAVLAFCRSSWKIGVAGAVVALASSFIFRGFYGTTEPMLLLACTALCMMLFTVKTYMDKRGQADE